MPDPSAGHRAVRAAVHPGGDVSRETLDRLGTLADEIRRWTPRINLVAASTLPDLWTRHIADCAQLWPLRPDPCRTWLDLGSGAGLPGLVIAALAAETPAGPSVTLTEADARKAAFLASTARAMRVRVAVLNRRIETIDLPPPDVISARALAPLPQLLALAARIAGPDTVCLFPKGARVSSELTAARTAWHSVIDEIASRTDPNAKILRVSKIERRHAPPE